MKQTTGKYNLWRPKLVYCAEDHVNRKLGKKPGKRYSKLAVNLGVVASVL